MRKSFSKKGRDGDELEYSLRNICKDGSSLRMLALDAREDLTKRGRGKVLYD